MAPISYQKAVNQNLIKEVDLRRMAVVVLSHVDSFKPDYELCAKHYGGTKDAFRVAYQGYIRKLREQGCEDPDATVTPLNNSNGGTTPKTPRTPKNPKTPKTSGGLKGGVGLGKRPLSTLGKYDSAMEQEDDEVDGDNLYPQESPSKKKAKATPKSTKKTKKEKDEDECLVMQLKAEMDEMDEDEFTSF